MAVYLLLCITLLLAVTAIWRLAVNMRYPLVAVWGRVLVNLSLALFTYLFGTWVYLSVYGKYVFGSCILAILIIGLFIPKKPYPPVRRKMRLGSTIVVAIIVLLDVLYFSGTVQPSGTAELAFPLHSGRYFVLQGGKGLPTNLFHYSYRGAVFAIDIVKLNSFGNRASHIFSSQLEDYEIFADTVFSPCDGVILRTRNDNPDNLPPNRERGPSNTNQVMIAADAFYVFMAHFKYGSVMVQEGDTVRTGQPLALVGNSGFSLEPHLHIQVHARSGNDGAWFRGEPLLIKFDGRSYNMFESITPKKVRMRE